MSLALVGEAWGTEEEKLKRPFVGRAGKKLDSILHQLGHSREEVDIFNVMNEKPPRNDFGVYYKDKDRLEPTDKLLKAWQKLQQVVDVINPNCVLCLGKEALRAFVGYKSMDKYRGTIFKVGNIKVMGTYHPASIFRNYGRTGKGIPIEPVILIDLFRAFNESKFLEIRQKQRVRRVARYASEVVEFFEPYIHGWNMRELCVDIETLEDGIDCIGFATSPTNALLVPFRYEHNLYWNNNAGRIVYNVIKCVLESEFTRVIGQNYYYDNYWLLRKWNIETANLFYDTLVAMKVCYPDFPASLAFQTSLFNDIGYYKDDRKVIRGKSIDFKKRWNYCCNDVLSTFENSIQLRKELKHYDEKYKSMVERVVD